MGDRLVGLPVRRCLTVAGVDVQRELSGSKTRQVGQGSQATPTPSAEPETTLVVARSTTPHADVALATSAWRREPRPSGLHGLNLAGRNTSAASALELRVVLVGVLQKRSGVRHRRRCDLAPVNLWVATRLLAGFWSLSHPHRTACP